MGGGLLQIINYGTQDLTLTGNPEITFFNIVYRRYTNFGKRYINTTFINDIDFGRTSELTIPKNNGDLISNITLKIKLPKLDFTFINNIFNSYSISNNINNTNNNNNFKDSFTTYEYFNNFYNKLFNIVNLFFIKYDSKTDSRTYINDLAIEIQNYITIPEFQQFFESIKYFYDNDIKNLTSENSSYNLEIYTNASLFKFVNNNDLIYIYDKPELNFETMSYNEFKNLIYKNMDILYNLNDILYNKVLDNISNRKITVSWVNKIASYLIEYINIYIGTNKINSLSSNYINNYANLNYKNKDLYNKLIGNNHTVNISSLIHEETYLYLPIPFWTLNNYGLAFPSIALQFNTIQIKLGLRKFEKCIKINTNNIISDPSTLNNLILNSVLENQNEIIKTPLQITLKIEYIYLDNIERKKFAQNGHEYLIDQIQEIEEIIDVSQIPNINSELQSVVPFQYDLFHCCKDLYWFITCEPKNIVTTVFNTNITDPYNYTLPQKQISTSYNQQVAINYYSMLFNPKILFNPETFINGVFVIENNYNLTVNTNINKIPFTIILDTLIKFGSEDLTQHFTPSSNFYNFLQPFNYYKSTPQLGTNIYSFSLNPTEYQPSGTCNFSRIPNFTINANFNKIINSSNGNQYNYKFVLQVRNFNILRIIGGISGLAFTYNNN